MLPFLSALSSKSLRKLPSHRVASIRFYSEDVQEDSAEKPERVFFKKPEVIDNFPVFDVYMNKKSQEARRKFVVHEKKDKDTMARYNQMSTDQDWTNAWPTASTFKQNAVPLPVNQGYIKSRCENDGLPPTKYANAELMKIPNFLHLTPPHIKKHCNAIKKFCTPWPEQLTTDEQCREFFPIETTTSTYIYDGPSLRDDRARIVTLQIKVSDLNLDARALNKFIKLAEHRYDKETDMLTLVADRCPYRRQNEDYANYLLTTLYHESQAVEEWESEMTEEDYASFEWEKTKSKENVLEALAKVEASGESHESLLKSRKISQYKDSVKRVFDEGESQANLNDYKKSVMDILNLKKTDRKSVV